MAEDSRDLTAVLLIAHGSRLDNANDELAQLAARLRDEGTYSTVEISYLEIAEPTISDGARRCVERGATRVLMLPFFLSAGRHVTSDLQRHRGELDEQFGDVVFQLRPPLGLHPLMIEIVLDRLRGDGG